MCLGALTGPRENPRCRPKFTFSHFTRDPNLHNPHSHKTHINTTPNLHRTQIYKTPDLHHLKFTKPRFTQTQIYTASILHKAQIYKVPNLHIPKFTTPKFASGSLRPFGPVSGSNVASGSSVFYLTRGGGIMSHHYMGQIPQDGENGLFVSLFFKK